MSDRDQEAVVRYHGVRIQPTINYLETAIPAERALQPFQCRLVKEDQVGTPATNPTAVIQKQIDGQHWNCTLLRPGARVSTQLCCMVFACVPMEALACVVGPAEPWVYRTCWLPLHLGVTDQSTPRFMTSG
jgi:hypothetical protein